MQKQSAKKGLEILFRHIRKHKKELAALSALSIVIAVADGAIPFITGRLFDSILRPSEIFSGAEFQVSLLSFYLGLFIVFKICSAFAGWIMMRKSENLGNITYCDYRLQCISQLLRLPISFHKDEKIGEITERIHRATSWLSTIVSNVLVDLTPQFLSFIVAFSILFYLNPFLSFILALAVFVYIGILVRMIRPMADMHKNLLRFQAQVFGDAADVINNIQSVKEAAAEEYEEKRLFKKMRLELVKIWNEAMFYWQNLDFLQTLIIVAAHASILFVSIPAIRQNSMTIGELVTFISSAQLLFGPFTRLARNWRSVQNGLIALEENEKIFVLPKENYRPENAPILPFLEGKIVFKDVNFSYEKSLGNVLENINFEINPGEIVALVGESGVGKSSLVSLLSGFYFPQKGKIFIDGHNIKNMDLTFLRSNIAVVSQEPALFNDTIKKNIAYGKFSADDKDIENAAEKSYASEFIKSFPGKYGQLVGERGVKLSAGQKQRVAIARAVLRDPRILVLDEPTSALDAKSEKFIQESLKELMKNRTTIIIAHRLSTVRKADKILVLKNGKIAEQGKHDDLVQIPNGIYRNLYELQIGLAP